MSARVRAWPGVTAATTLLLVITGGVAGQPLDLEWQARPERAITVEGRRVIFGPVHEVDLQVIVANVEDAMDFVTIAPGFFQSLNIRLDTVDTFARVAVLVRWDDEAVCGDVATTCSLSLRTSLPPGAWMRATATLAAPDGAMIEEGEYRVSLDFTAARTSLLGVDNEPWRGRMHQQGAIALVVRRVANADDRREHYRIEAGSAHARGDLSVALAFYQMWAAEFPDEISGLAGVGAVLLEIGRVEEAVESLERALMHTRREYGLLPYYLATAYVAMGREEQAIRTLERHVAPDAIPRAMEAARSEANRIQRR